MIRQCVSRDGVYHNCQLQKTTRGVVIRCGKCMRGRFGFATKRPRKTCAICGATLIETNVHDKLKEMGIESPLPSKYSKKRISKQELAAFSRSRYVHGDVLHNLGYDESDDEVL